MDELNWKDKIGKCEYCCKIAKRFDEIGKFMKYHCNNCNVITIKISDIKREGLQIKYVADQIIISYIDRDD